VDKTHPGLGKLVAFECVAALARKCVLVVAPAGCGKSAAAMGVGNAGFLPVFSADRISVAAFREAEQALDGFSGLVIVDDISKAGTHYSQLHTVTSLAELCYGHNYRYFARGGTFEIKNFYGAVILNIQPVKMSHICGADEWEASIRDKTIRYYHLIRPRKPHRGVPAIRPGVPRDLSSVRLGRLSAKVLEPLKRMGMIQWSAARANEHIPDLLKATAAWAKRKQVSEEDARVLFWLLQPMALERFLLEKTGFETNIWFRDNVFCILSELASFNDLTVEQICRDYHISPSTVYRLLEQNKEWCWVKRDKKAVIKPTKAAYEALTAAGYHCPEPEEHAAA
jgi:hypothetical protein